MAKYRKIDTVQAEQFLPQENKIPDGVIPFSNVKPIQYVIKTLEGFHYLRDGDYICTGVDGEIWNVEKTIFERTYEKAPETEIFQLDNSRLDR